MDWKLQLKRWMEHVDLFDDLKEELANIHKQ